MPLTFENMRKKEEIKLNVGDFFVVTPTVGAPKLRSVVVSGEGYAFISYNEGVPAVSSVFPSLEDMSEAVVKSWDTVEVIPAERVKLLLNYQTEIKA